MIDLKPERRPTIFGCYTRFKDIVKSLSPPLTDPKLEIVFPPPFQPRQVSAPLPKSRAQWDDLDMAAAAEIWESLRGYIEEKGLTLFDRIDGGRAKFVRGPVDAREALQFPDGYDSTIDTPVCLLGGLVYFLLLISLYLSDQAPRVACPGSVSTTTKPFRASFTGEKRLICFYRYNNDMSVKAMAYGDDGLSEYKMWQRAGLYGHLEEDRACFACIYDHIDLGGWTFTISFRVFDFHTLPVNTLHHLIVVVQQVLYVSVIFS